jgi:leucyl aminopeptidase (aminopeptidase T)
VSADWTIDTIVHALPSPDMRQQALREIHLAPVDQLADVVAKWRAIAIEWTTAHAPLIETARAHYEATGKLPAEYEETAESADRFDAWRHRMEQLRDQGQAGAA